jgi:Putative MetA-pathway of phenol degradation
MIGTRHKTAGRKSVARDTILAIAAAIAAGSAVQALTSRAAHAASWESLKVFTGVDYSSGDYGETTNTDIVYVPLTVKYETGPWTLRATTSYIRIHGPANVIGTGEGGSYVTDVGPGGRLSRSGPGDILLGVTYSLDSLWAHGWFVDLTGKVKLPTADENKGLGTGKTDFTAQLDVAKILGRFTPFATIALRKIGQPAAYRLHDALNGSVGLQYRVSDVVGTGFSFDYRESASPTGTDPRELFGYVNIAVTDNWSVDLYGVAGLSDGSPDAAAGFQLTFRTR